MWKTLSFYLQLFKAPPLSYICCVYICCLFPFLVYIGKNSIISGVTFFNVSALAKFCRGEESYNALGLLLAGFPLHGSLSPARQSTLFLCPSSHSHDPTAKKPPAPEFELNLSWNFAF